MTDTVTPRSAEQVFGDEQVPSGPAKLTDRIKSLDFIRGLAVMGILWANIVAFGQPTTAYMTPSAFLVPAGDPGGWQWITQFVLIDGKMRGLFTILFGAGLYLFMERAWARGENRWLQARRLMWLLAFGLIHFYFIWFGDILALYAICGLIILLCLRWSVEWQLRISILGYITGAILYAAMMAFPYLVAETPMGDAPVYSEMREGMLEGIEQAKADDAAETAYIQSGDYAGLVGHRFTDHGADPFVNVLFVGLETLPLMLLGVALYRLGFFSGGFSRSGMVRWGWIGLIVGALLHLAIGLWAKSTGFSFYGSIAAMLGFSPIPRLIMTLGMAALLVVYSPGWTGWLGQRISAAGRAAFTNYLGTSVLLLFVFQGWALGLFGELNRPQLYLVMVAVWVIMLAWSKPWLERFKYGPLEWLWRCLTYWKLFALRR